MQTRLTVPISAQNIDQAKQQIKEARDCGAEMLELRTDYLENLTVDMVRELVADIKKAPGGNLPVIVTCRDKAEGGMREYPQQLRIDVLVAGLKAGAEFIDFEFNSYMPTSNQARIRVALSQSLKGRLILSAHSFESRFPSISMLRRRMAIVAPAAIPKIVYTANHINDCFDAFDLLHNTGGDRIVFCMGKAGIISRIIAKKLGSFLSFASLDQQSATAAGQLTIEQFIKRYHYHSINAQTGLYGVIGSPIAHSLSPAIHNTGFTAAGLNKLYLPLLVEGGSEEFDNFLRGILARGWLGFEGLSVTIPHKENAYRYITVKNGQVDPLSRRIGAVNTIVTGPDGRLRAYNTDYSAAMDSITSAANITRDGLKKMPVSIIGAGGISRTIVAALADTGAEITIFNRTLSRAENLADEFNCRAAPLKDLPDTTAKLLINCTSVGMYPNIDETPVPQEYLKKDMVVFDTIYNPAQTLLLKQAKKAGAKTIDGISMFVNQALAQFKFFTGQDGDRDMMRKVVTENLGH